MAVQTSLGCLGWRQIVITVADLRCGARVTLNAAISYLSATGVNAYHHKRHRRHRQTRRPARQRDPGPQHFITLGRERRAGVGVLPVALSATPSTRGDTRLPSPCKHSLPHLSTTLET